MADDVENQITVTEDDLVKAREITNSLTVNVLQDMIVTLNETKLKLLMTIKDLKHQLSQQKVDQADIYYYLNKKCDDAFEIIASLEEQLMSEQTDREIAEKIYEKKISDLQSSAMSMENRFQAKIRELEDRLITLKDFGERKEESERLLQNLIETLDSERKQFVQNTDDMEKKWLLERERLKREYAEKENTVKGEVNERVEEKLSQVTKKTMQRNMALKNELKYQSVQADKVIVMSKNIIERDKDLRIELEIAQATEKEMTLKLSTYQKVIKQLNERISSDEEKEAQRAKEHEEELLEKDTQIASLLQSIQDLEAEVKAENKQLDEMWTFLSGNLADLRTITKKKLKPNKVSLTSLHDAGLGEHEYLLQELILRLLYAFPQKFASVVQSYVASCNPANIGTQEKRNETLLGLSKLQIGENASTFSQDGPFLPSIYSNSQSSKVKSIRPQEVTGIPSWDTSKSVAQADEDNAPRQRTVGCQTEGRILQIPTHSVLPVQFRQHAPSAPPPPGSVISQDEQSNSQSIYTTPNLRSDHTTVSTESKSVKSLQYPGQASYSIKGGRNRGYNRRHVTSQHTTDDMDATMAKSSKQNEMFKKKNLRAQRTQFDEPIMQTNSVSGLDAPDSWFSVSGNRLRGGSQAGNAIRAPAVKNKGRTGNKSEGHFDSIVSSLSVDGSEYMPTSPQSSVSMSPRLDTDSIA